MSLRYLPEHAENDEISLLDLFQVVEELQA